MMDRYLPGIITVINGDASPSEAIRLVEEIELSLVLSNPASSNNLINNQTPATPQTEKVKSQPSSPTKSQPSSPKQATELETFRRLSKEEMLRLRDWSIR